MVDQWTITEMEDALAKLPGAPAKCRYYYDKHGVPHITLTVKVRGDLYVKSKLSDIDFTKTLEKVLIRLFHLGVPLNEAQRRLDGVIEGFATFEETKYQKSLIEIEEKDRKVKIIKEAFGESDLTNFRRRLPENDTENTYISWWKENAREIKKESGIEITEADLTSYVREALKCLE